MNELLINKPHLLICVRLIFNMMDLIFPRFTQYLCIETSKIQSCINVMITWHLISLKCLVVLWEIFKNNNISTKLLNSQTKLDPEASIHRKMLCCISLFIHTSTLYSQCILFCCSSVIIRCSRLLKASLSSIFLFCTTCFVFITMFHLITCGTKGPSATHFIHPHCWRCYTSCITAAKMAYRISILAIYR